jgi:hypothetical protein
MASMMNESDKAWRDSFDPKHPDYHGGITMPAPYADGAKAVPVGATEFAENPEPVNESYKTDPEYLVAMDLRTQLMN